MGIFGNILNKVVELATGVIHSDAPSTSSVPTAQGSAVPEALQVSHVQALSAVDLTAKLDEQAAKNKEKLNWKTSIVDLMKLLGLDSSLAARKELAKELHYSGDTGDSAAMNIWLHKQVLTKISENGGNVPQDLLS